ncbi:MAG TPA: hypothetical protein VLA89_14495 [Gemmatimonadales bacterium]|nr:hypothetical protein [Gemmatimonadales bacterium]
MPQYRDGQARALSSQPSRIELVGGLTTNNITQGDYFRFQADVAAAWFSVSNVLSATVFELSTPYNAAQALDTLLPYIIVRDFTPNLLLPELAPGDIAIREVYTQAMRILDALAFRGAPGTFSFVGTITAGDKPFRWYAPIPLLTRTVHVALGTPASGVPLIVDVKKNGASIFANQSAMPQIAVGQYAAEVSIVTQLALNDFLTVNIVQASGSDLVVQVRF